MGKLSDKLLFVTDTDVSPSGDALVRGTKGNGQGVRYQRGVTIMEYGYKKKPPSGLEPLT